MSYWFFDLVLIKLSKLNPTRVAWRHYFLTNQLARFRNNAGSLDQNMVTDQQHLRLIMVNFEKFSILHLFPRLNNILSKPQIPIRYDKEKTNNIFFFGIKTAQTDEV